MSWVYFKPVFIYQKSLQDTFSIWSGHRYFVYDLIRNIEPKTIVELGTHHGTSFFSMCQSVQDSGYKAQKLVPIDTWTGDKHAGFYDESVYKNFVTIKDSFYPSLPVHTMRMTFDEAHSSFSDTSIDLLHIDGLHTYDAVKHDFKNWLPKMKSNGVILLHDICVREGDFGVYKLWEELQREYVTFEFSFAFGLGVVFLDRDFGLQIKQREKEFQLHYLYAYEMNNALYAQQYEQKVQHTELSLKDVIHELEVQGSFVQGEKNILIQQMDKQREVFFEQQTLSQNEIKSHISLLSQKESLLHQKDEALLESFQNIETKNNEIKQLGIENKKNLEQLGKISDDLVKSEIEIKELSEKVAILASNISSQNQTLQTLQQHADSLAEIVVTRDRELEFVRASKFWKLRADYMRSKWAISHPIRFIKKYFFRKSTFLHEKKVALYIASNGNYFFKEILLIIKEGFLELGYTVSVKDESDEFGGDYDWHIVIAPHEFFFICDGNRFRDSVWPERTIIVNLEQPHLYWFQLVKQCLSKAHAVWDINIVSQKILEQEHPRVSFLPLGYSKAIAKNNTIIDVPVNQTTETLDKTVLRGNFQEKPLVERPIDICFIGVLSERRDEFFARYGSLFTKYNCYFYFWNGKQPMITGTNTSMDTKTAQGIIQRSKIIINVHQGEHPYFEWHRIVNQGIANRTLVVSEACTYGDLFIPGTDFVSSDLEHIPGLIEYYLDPKNIAEAQTMVNRAYKKYTEEYSMKNILKTNLKKLS